MNKEPFKIKLFKFLIAPGLAWIWVMGQLCGIRFEAYEYDGEDKPK